MWPEIGTSFFFPCIIESCKINITAFSKADYISDCSHCIIKPCVAKASDGSL